MKEVVPHFQELVAAIGTGKIESALKVPVLEPIVDTRGWTLQHGDRTLAPLEFSNGKTQEDIVNEVVDHIQKGTKVVFVHGVCGTGKSAIALHIARKLGRASLVVPVRELQRQYEVDYMQKMHVVKPNGARLKIAMITGRENHPSLFLDGSCADSNLPELIKINERSMSLLKSYQDQNPFLRSVSTSLKEIKRLSIAPANPFWSPILPAHFDPHLPDAEKKKYKGLRGKEFVFYHRKHGCSYYDQYQAYIDADVIIFNAAKYTIESALDRKPATDVEIIDEADEFLDNFSEQATLNLTRLGVSLGFLPPSSPDLEVVADQLREIISGLERTHNALEINEEAIHALPDTRLGMLLTVLSKNKSLVEEAQIDETNYVLHAFEVAHAFAGSLSESYVSFYRRDKDLYASLVSSNLSKRFGELIAQNKALVLMSGTLHEASVLRNVFGIKEYAMVEAETLFPGSIDIMRTGKEFDCRYSRFSAKEATRESYLKALDTCVARAPRPTLVHVNAFEDMPTMEEMHEYGLKVLEPREALRERQQSDRDGKTVTEFKRGIRTILFTTKCARGVDFPGKMCNSVIFTKFPNPNPNETFWKVLQRTHKDQFWDVYRDKARREFLQRLYRALRSKEDHVYVLSPDTRILDAVADLQRRA